MPFNLPVGARIEQQDEHDVQRGVARSRTVRLVRHVHGSLYNRIMDATSLLWRMILGKKLRINVSLLDPEMRPTVL